jgi:serine protease Do
MQHAIRETEESVVSILVSRSDAYRRIFHDHPPEDSPGQLGGFPKSVAKPEPAPISEDLVRKYDLAAPDQVPEAWGSGLVIDGRELLVLTNYHVVRDATKVYVRLSKEKGSYANIHAADPRSDMAVLRLLDETAGPLKEIKFGSGDASQRGRIVVTVACPFAPGFRGSDRGVSWGIISNVHRWAVAASGEEDKRALYLLGTLLQTDVPLYRTCSGSALVNLKGETIGLTTSRPAVPGSEAAGGFAVPIDRNIKRTIERLRQGAEVEYGFLGVQCQKDPRRGQGLWIHGVVGGSPAEKAGLRLGDGLFSINSVPVAEPNDVFLRVALLPPGSTARVEVRRSPSNDLQMVSVTLAKHYTPGKVIAFRRPPSVRGMRVDYTSVLYTQREGLPAVAFQRRDIPPGVCVVEVQDKTAAADAKLRVNDIVSEVNGRKVDNPNDFYREAAKIPATSPLELTLLSAEWPIDQQTTKTIVP